MSGRVLMMVADHGVSFTEALDWVTHRMPRGLKSYWKRRIKSDILETLFSHEIIELTEEVK